METNETTILQNEIARLNKVITILVEQNDALRHQLWLKTNGNASENDGIAHAENGKASPKLGIAFTENGKGNPDEGVAPTENGNGTPIVMSPVHENGNGNTIDGIAIAENGNGNPTLRRPVHENANGQTGLLPPLPATLPVSPHNMMAMREVLKGEGYNKVRYDARDNTTRLLIHFYNQGGGGYPELKKLTSLTKYGLAKFIRSLKKRGLIERNGWQKFKITAQGIHLLQRAGCKA